MAADNADVLAVNKTNVLAAVRDGNPIRNQIDNSIAFPIALPRVHSEEPKGKRRHL